MNFCKRLVYYSLITDSLKYSGCTYIKVKQRFAIKQISVLVLHAEKRLIDKELNVNIYFLIFAQVIIFSVYMSPKYLKLLCF